VADQVAAAREDVALGRHHAAQLDEPPAHREELLALVDVGLGEHRVHEAVDLVVDALQHREERVGQGVQDAVDRLLLGLGRLALHPLPGPREELHRDVVDGDHPVAAEVHVDLGGLAVGAHAVEDQQRGLAVVVELGPLPELQRVLQRQRVHAEALAEVADLLRAGIVEVQPEEVIARQQLPESVVVERVADVHRAIVAAVQDGKRRGP
jgi:hypothetical protein